MKNDISENIINELLNVKRLFYVLKQINTGDTINNQKTLFFKIFLKF